ncbi:zinc-binding dehydrogenase [Streptomyces sp. NPDC046805]|uniref:zinc-binding dehydrogenase n=1 Tax=Streptomyces sp. NPDC046805 TaxID=3155134 RepID=UPI0033D6E828
MKRAIATQVSKRPADVIDIVDLPAPEERPGWVRVDVKATALNQHDLWSIRGVGVKPEQFPLGVGSDVAGVTAEGREVLVHSLVTDPANPTGSELLDPARAMLAERTTGGAADAIWVPTRNLVDKPSSMSFETAACLPTAWLTAYRMLYGVGEARPGQSVLVQGATGGVAQAAISLAIAGGLQVHVTARTEDGRAVAEAMGAHVVLESGGRLPQRVDLVIETVGQATWEHSLRSVKPGGAVVVSGATTGGSVTVDLFRVFIPHVRILGSSMGTISDLRDLVALIASAGIEPAVDSVHPLDATAEAVARLAGGQAVGKVLIRP